MNEENSKEKNSYGLVKLLIVTTIVVVFVICIINTFAIFFVCCPNVINRIFDINMPNVLPETKIEATLLSTGLSIIGIAISVWAGLNIINVLERKEYETIKAEMNKQKNELTNSTVSVKEIGLKQNKTNKAKLLNEMYNTVQDQATRALIEKIRHLEESQDFDFLPIIEVEQTFNSVYHLHNRSLPYDEELLNEAQKGIGLCKEMLKNSDINSTIELYLEYRIAEFYFYSGYCCEKCERKNYYDKAIEIYFKVYKCFDAQLPIYKSNLEYPDFEFKECRKNTSEISAYFCNSIGESYSKIIEVNEHVDFEDNELKEYSQKAIFYCAYASRWDKRETYWRNLGCALERYYGVKSENYDDLIEIYKNALKEEVNPKAFRVLLSASNKLIDGYLNIEKVNVDVGRQPPLYHNLYQESWQKLDEKIQGKLLNILYEFYDMAKKAKTLYPLEKDGYIYSCIYHRDMSIINIDKSNIAKAHLDEAKKEHDMLKIIAPNIPLTKILEADLKSLSSKID